MDWEYDNEVEEFEEVEEVEVELIPDDKEDRSGYVALTGLTFERDGKKIRIKKGEDVPAYLLEDNDNGFNWLSGERHAIEKK